jgi:hypothetical protein
MHQLGFPLLFVVVGGGGVREHCFVTKNLLWQSFHICECNTRVKHSFTTDKIESLLVETVHQQKMSHTRRLMLRMFRQTRTTTTQDKFNPNLD